MSDLSTSLATLYPFPADKNEAIEYIEETYSGASYNKNTDTFSYRGMEFDYFVSGRFVSMDGSPTKYKCGYLLVDREFRQNWVFTYGDPEEMWINFINHRKLTEKINTPPKRTLIERILNFIYG